MAESPLSAVNPEYVEAHFTKIVQTYASRTHASFYDLAADFAEFGRDADDTNTITWLRGGAAVNLGMTPASEFIRSYTAAQILARVWAH